MLMFDLRSDVFCSDLYATPQFVSDILFEIGALDGQEPATGKRAHIDSLLDLACGSGSLLLNVRNRMGAHGIGKIYGQEKNITTYNIEHMNMLLHGVKDNDVAILQGAQLPHHRELPLKNTRPQMSHFAAVVD